jgi:S-adenosyl-L-methionine hydrolase (adenosine-forming)
MTTHRLLTLLTDFGSQDVYVAVMKGVIAQINPTLTIIDLTHEIPAQNIAAARFNLMSAYPYFPDGTVHIAVVDPGVGTQRRAIAVQLADGFLVAPDNGLLSGVLSQHSVVAAVELTNVNYWRNFEPSATFHGRDIFASVGAHLATGVALEQMGKAIAPESLTPLTLLPCIPTAEGFLGCIQHIDRFGNLITNIPAQTVQHQNWTAIVGQKSIPSCQTYADGAIGELLALMGSHDWLEIAVNQGSAQAQLQLTWGSPIRVLIA